ncbi:phosphatidylinositol 4-kinase alpha-like [Lineus longissimus]|uniref:phosphatidylinositol 4-kinase alpha-like n=1 Tax=Lineus longissimus TaxID=88925 RepID=UPI00315CF329
MAAAEKDFYSNSLLLLARSLAALNPTPWEKVVRLLSLCPQVTQTRSIKLDQRGQQAVTALGLYLLESGLQYHEKIIEYLLSVLKALPKAQWIEATKLESKDKLPVSECFTFCLCTVLSDVARENQELQEKIVSAQLETFQALARILQSPNDVSKRKYLIFFQVTT